MKKEIPVVNATIVRNDLVHLVTVVGLKHQKKITVRVYLRTVKSRTDVDKVYVSVCAGS